MKRNRKLLTENQRKKKNGKEKDLLKRSAQIEERQGKQKKIHCQMD